MFLLATLAAAQPAAAFWNDRFEVFADEAMTWDSNVFRLSRNVDPQATTGNSSRGDRYNVHSLGATMDLPYSLQRFTAGYTWYATRYNHFDQLDFNGHTARANWAWAVTPHLTGDVGATDARSLANFANFATVGGGTRDLVNSRQVYANGQWEVSPALLLYAGATRNEREHEDPARRVNDVRADAVEARASFVSAAGNRLGVSVRREQGDSPEQVFAGVPFNNAYRQDGVGLVGRWTLSGLSRVDGRVDYVKRDYEQFSERDYRGPSFRVTWNYTPTGKLTFDTSVYREIAPLDDIQTAFVLVKGIGVRPRWDVTAKIAVIGSLDYARWEYRAGLPFSPAPGAPVVAGDYRHRVRSAGVSVVWRPYTRVMFQAGVLREVRSSTLENADYEVNVATLEARIGF